MTIDELQVLITANTTNLQKEIAKANKNISTLQKTTTKTQNAITSGFKKMKTAIVALGIGKVIKDSIQQGMDAIESDSLFETSLGKWSDSVREWSNEMSKALGLNAVNIRKNTGVIYNMTSSMGVAEENALKMSKGISLLSEDMASFYNLSSTEAFNKLRAGLTGETEPLKALGILVDENTVKQVAYSSGIAETGSELTQQQKVLARYVAILKQTGNAQGDLARTINSPANQLRMLKNQIQQIGLALSNFFLPIIQAVLPYITAFAQVITSALNSLAKFMGLKSTNASDETAKINSNIGGLGSGLDNANKKAKTLKGTLASFDEMNVIQDSSSENSSESGSTVSGGIDFDVSEYDAHLEWISSNTDKIVKKIQKSFSKIGETLKNIWESDPVQAYTNLISTEFNFIKDLSLQLGTDLWNNITTTWFNIEENFSNGFNNVSTLFTNMWTDMSLGIETWGQPIIDGISNLFNSIWTTAIDPAIQLISKCWEEFSGILVKTWDKYGKPLIDNIGEFVTTIIDLFQSIWDNIIEPIVTPFLEMLSELWDKHLKGLVTELGDFIGKLVNGALEIWNKFIYPIISWLLDKLKPVIETVSSFVMKIFGTIFGVISDVIGGILKTLGGVIDFIVGVFTGDWSKAWEGVKSIFSGIWDALKGVVKGVINVIIDVLNGFIKGINFINFDVPDWVPVIGGKKWGFNIKPIQKLARGGVIDKPTQAIIGEAGKEVVMPLERNTGWIDTLANKLADKIGGNNDVPIYLTVNVGEDTIFDKFISYQKQKDFETNGEVFDL